MIAHFHERGEMAGWGFWMLAVGLVLLLLLIVLAFLALRGSPAHRPAAPGHWPAPPAPGAPGPGGTSNAERILAERFAHGEIDEEEYQRRLRVLRGPDQPGSP